MIIEHFLKWSESARVAERAAAANALARAYLRSNLDFDERCAAEAALTLLLEDPSPKVRFAMAEALSLSAGAPQQVVAALALDRPDIAELVLVRSPLFSDAELVDHVAEGGAERQRAVAMRPRLSAPVSAAVAEVADAPACLALLANPGASIAPVSLRRVAERHGADGAVRTALLADSRLPGEMRHLLLVRVGEALSGSTFLRGAIGEDRATRVAREACGRASLALIETMPPSDHVALVEQFRLRRELTPAFLIRAVAHGRIDFFGAALVSLAGEERHRVGALLNRGRDVALAALFRASGLAAATHPALLTALRLWRDVATGKRLAGAQEIAWAMLKTVETRTDDAGQEVAALLRSIHLDTLRENARGHAMALKAAA